MKKIFIYGMIVLLSALVSCDSWLDVKPTDRTSGDVLFEDLNGFQKALNGVYVELNNRSIYGRNMTATMLDIMAQYYTISSSSGVYDRIVRYNYEDVTYNKPVYQAMWEKCYNLIVNLNVIINQCGESNPALSGIWHGLIKGEALATRAFFHLDMLRLFGPVYSENRTTPCIPYVKNTDQMVSPLLSAEQVGKLIIEDLTEAIALLKNSDPIIEDGVMNSSASEGNGLRYRQYRMNYYAARALLARTYMWIGDHQNAYKTATELLQDIPADSGGTFPFTTAANATDATIPDRMFSTEVMFSAYDNYRSQDIHNNAFHPELSATSILRFAYPNNGALWSGRISQLFDNIDDYRYKMWFATFPTMSGTSVHFFRKYENPGSSVSLTAAQVARLATFSRMIPLIRISEVYLIAAESAIVATGNLSEATSYLSKLRAARNVADLPAADFDQLRNHIEWEFRREFLGEGQMFYFYKRIKKGLIPDGANTGTNTIEMTTVKYVVTLPDSEANERSEN